MNFTVTLSLNWELLRDQKALLISLAEDHPLLDGVVTLIDELQDRAYDQGCDVKWLPEEEASDDHSRTD